MPSIVLGANDPSTNDLFTEGKNDYGIGGVGAPGNGHWNRYYLALTKHFSIKNIGELGIHLAYVYNKRKDYHLNGPAFGANFRLAFPGSRELTQVLNHLNFMADVYNHCFMKSAAMVYKADFDG